MRRCRLDSELGGRRRYPGQRESTDTSSWTELWKPRGIVIIAIGLALLWAEEIAPVRVCCFLLGLQWLAETESD